jgi:hypothetical protein
MALLGGPRHVATEFPSPAPCADTGAGAASREGEQAMKDQPEFREVPPEPIRPDFLAEAARRQGWAFDNAPLFAAMTRSREMAFSFARFGLAILVFLNVVGLFGLPTLAQLIGAHLASHLQLVLSSLGAFTIGVTAAAVATLMAFLAMSRDSAAIYRHLERIGEARGSFGMSAGTFVRSKIEMERDLQRDQRMRARALRFGLLAFGSFLVGAIFATVYLTTQVPRAPERLRIEASSPAPATPIQPMRGDESVFRAL